MDIDKKYFYRAFVVLVGQRGKHPAPASKNNSQ